MITDEAIEISLRTWYPPDHPLHYNPHHPLGKLCGEWGELLDDHMKSIYKPGYKANFLDELGDIWYYIRILCYQRDYQPIKLNLCNHMPESNLLPDELITMAIREVSSALLSFVRYDRYSPLALDVSYTVLLELLDRQHTTLGELTELNWQKLQPGSEKDNEWVKARETA